MSLKSILVVMSGGAGDESRLASAIALAQTHKAKLVALHVKPSSMLDVATTAFDSTESVLGAVQRSIEARAAEAESCVEAAGKQAGFPIEWRCEEGEEARISAAYARYAGLVFASPKLARDLVFSSGGPVLVIPDWVLPRPFKRVLIAWNGSQEAARAVRDAMPLLEAAESVDVLVVDPPGRLPIGRDLGRMLACHGIKADVRARVATSVDVGAVIMDEARTSGAELLIMGAYGHSRLREWALGGATEDALRNAPIPVLLAH
jgi:nucleotide-binding universal stress UspA family protein